MNPIQILEAKKESLLYDLKTLLFNHENTAKQYHHGLGMIHIFEKDIEEIEKALTILRHESNFDKYLGSPE